MERGASFKIIFRGCLVIRPTRNKKNQSHNFENSVEGGADNSWDGVLHLLSAEDESLLHGWNAFLLFDALFYPGYLNETGPSFSNLFTPCPCIQYVDYIRVQTRLRREKLPGCVCLGKCEGCAVRSIV